MLPGEVKLTARMQNRPFALIGIDTDKDLDQLKKVMSDNGVTWRNTWANSKDPGSLPAMWNIHGYPTVMLIDANGVIRKKHLGVSESELMKEIDKLVEEAEQASGTPAK